MRLKQWLLAATCAMSFLPLPGVAEQHVQTDPASDTLLRHLREAGLKNRAEEADKLAARLADYPIPSYVEYYRIRPRLQNLDSVEKEARAFLHRYDGQAIADRFRNDWLLELGEAGRWELFDEQYPLFFLKDDLQVTCYALMSRAHRGEDVAREARQVLVSPRNYGGACPQMMRMLRAKGQFSEDDIWDQIRLAAENGERSAITAIVTATGVGEKKALDRAFTRPVLALARGPGKSREENETFVVALGRVARDNPQKAADFVRSAASRMSEKVLAYAWSQVAFIAARKLEKEAPEYWEKAAGIPVSDELHRWRVRSYLRLEDWPKVRASIEAMPEALRKDPAWVYWHGRALQAEGDRSGARKAFESIVHHFEFYGQLASEELGDKIMPPKGARMPRASEVAAMGEREGFRRSLKFYDLGMNFEGMREWNWEVRKMHSDNELLAAAEFARQSNVLDRMLSTSIRTTKSFDFTQRFPTPFLKEMQDNAGAVNLEVAWVYGLIRQESRFIRTARSHAGASGLMQIMPGTAKYVARKIGMKGFTQSQVNNIETNLLLGTRYLNMVLMDMDGSQAMATAAYNAGPNRMRSWRKLLDKPMEGAIFAEIIPFSETRGYVKNVLSNATYYAAMFQNEPQSLKKRLGIVTPPPTGEQKSDIP